MSMPRAVRHINERRVLDVVFRQGKVSRAGIARELALTRSTAGSIVASLVSEGLLLEDETKDDKSAGTGRPGTFVHLNPKHGLFVGADIGVGRISVIVIDFAATIVAERHVMLDDDRRDMERLLDQLASIVGEALCPLGGGAPVRGLCVTVPGVIDKAGVVLRAPFLGWKNAPLLQALTDRFPDIPAIAAENDANAFAIADRHRSGDSTGDPEIHLFLDAGIGGAVTTSGQLLRGDNGYAGEFGHMVLGETGFAKVATRAGSFESFVGREAILARYRQHGGTVDGLDDLKAQAGRGARAAIATLDDWAFYLGRGLSIITSIFDPSRIVLGGPVASLFDHCAEAVGRHIRSNLLEDQPIPVIELSRCGLEAPALGGALLLHRDLFAVDENLVFRSGSQKPA